jgi:hypothetical protein
MTARYRGHLALEDLVTGIEDDEIQKGHLGLAGEYAVASELCRLQVWAQVTLGNYKTVDLLVVGHRRTVTVQVKSKQGNAWPAVQGPPDLDHFIVLVDFKGKTGARPDFYVLNHSDWSRVVSKVKQRRPDLKIDEDGRISYPDGWKGLNLTVDLVRRCKDKWEKLTRRAGVNDRE